MTHRHPLRTTAVAASAAGLVLALGLPTAAHADDSTISAEIESTISLAVSGFDTPLTLRPTSTTTARASGDLTASVSTNSSAGYQLSLTTRDAQTALASTGGTTIAAIAGTPSAPEALSANTWGYRVDGGAFGDGSAAEAELLYAGVPASGASNVIKTHGTTATADATAVTFGVAVDSTKATGTYSQVVTLTAVAN